MTSPRRCTIHGCEHPALERFCRCCGLWLCSVHKHAFRRIEPEIQVHAATTLRSETPINARLHATDLGKSIVPHVEAERLLRWLMANMPSNTLEELTRLLMASDYMQENVPGLQCSCSRELVAARNKQARIKRMLSNMVRVLEADDG